MASMWLAASTTGWLIERAIAQTPPAATTITAPPPANSAYPTTGQSSSHASSSARKRAANAPLSGSSAAATKRSAIVNCRNRLSQRQPCLAGNRQRSAIRLPSRPRPSCRSGGLTGGLEFINHAFLDFTARSRAERPKFRRFFTNSPLTAWAGIGLRCRVGAGAGAVGWQKQEKVRRAGGGERSSERARRTAQGVASGNAPHRCGQYLDRQAPRLAGYCRRHRLRRQRRGAETLRYLVQLRARTAVGAVQHRVPAVLALDPARQRAHSHRHRKSTAAKGAAQHHRPHRACIVLAAADHRDDLHRRLVLPCLLWAKRAVEQCGRTAAVARKSADHDRICAPVSARAVGAGQTRRRHAPPDTGSA